MLMFKCGECGHVFEELKVVYEPYGERFSVCPYCGSGYFNIADRCDCCFKCFADSDLYNGMCETCLMDSATYENMVDFLVDQKWLFDFAFVEYLGAEEENLPTMTEEHVSNVRSFILGLKSKDARFHIFERMKKFIFADNHAIDDFAKFLKKIGVGKNDRTGVQKISCNK